MTTRLTKWLWAWGKSIAIALVIWLVLRTFVIESFHIPSGSMENTLLVGDFLFANKAVYGAEVPLLHRHLPAIREPRRGDIVVFRSVVDGSTIVKRLVGLSGDTLAMRAGREAVDIVRTIARERPLELAAFSISLAVKGLQASKTFYVAVDPDGNPILVDQHV